MSAPKVYHGTLPPAEKALEGRLNNGKPSPAQQAEKLGKAIAK